MKHDEIAKLLEKFMEGQTSLDEEQRLAQFFRTEEVPSEWTDYKLMFAEIEALDGHDCAVLPVVSVEEKTERDSAKPLFILLRKPFAALVAAAAVAALFVFVVFNGRNGGDVRPNMAMATAPTDTAAQSIPDTAATFAIPDSNAVRLKKTRKRQSFRRRYYVDDLRPLYANAAKTTASGSLLAADTTDCLLAIRLLEIEMDTTRMRLIQQQCEMEAYGKYLSNLVYANEGFELQSEEENGEGEEYIETY